MFVSASDSDKVEIHQGLTSEDPLLVEGNTMAALGGNYTSRDGFYITATMDADDHHNMLFFMYSVYKEIEEGRFKSDNLNECMLLLDSEFI